MNPDDDDDVGVGEVLNIVRIKKMGCMTCDAVASGILNHV